MKTRASYMFPRLSGLQQHTNPAAGLKEACPKIYYNCFQCVFGMGGKATWN